MGAAEVNTTIDAAVVAIEAENYDTALTKLLAAKALLIAIPDSGRQGMDLKYDREAVDSLIATVKELKAQASRASDIPDGIQRTKVEYVRPSA